jgi:hypothetical protein
MKLRHKLPSVFGLYMVDVLCCSLGCVILLWLFNDYKNALQSRQIAEQKDRLARLSEDQERREKDLARTRTDLADREKQASRLGSELMTRQIELEKLGKDLFSLQDRLKSVDKERMDVRVALDKTRKDLDETEKQRLAQADKAKDIATRRAEAEARLAMLDKELKDRTTLLALKDATAKDLMVTQAELEKKRLAASNRADVAEAALQAALKSMTDQKTMAATLSNDKDKAAKDLAMLQKRLGVLEAALVAETASRKDAEKLGAAAAMDQQKKERDLKDLQTRMQRIQQVAETRFAGIQLTGRKVVLAIDASGSMELIRADTASPEKWAEVGRVAGLVLDSLPDLEKFQVIVFSESSRWLLGDGSWIDYNRATSRSLVVDALSRVRPKGGTNLYEAFRMAFTLRTQGMDALYLLSDGLPNLGEGLTERQRESLREQEKGEVLGQYLRRKLRAEWNAENPNLPPVRINTLGFFYESPDLGAFLWALARENNGNFVGMNNP